MPIIPGSNAGGTQMAIPSTGSSGTTPAIGGQSNPLLPGTTSGTNMPPISDPLLSALAGLSPNSLFMPSGGITSAQAQAQHMSPKQINSINNWLPSEHQFIDAMHKAGFGAADAALLWSFIQSGAGFNPQVAQSMLAALQPGVERGKASILEQFGGQGLGYGSPAAIGLADFMQQVTLDEGQILSQLYENAVQNYLTVLLAGQKKSGSGAAAGAGSIVGGAGAAASGVASLIA